MKLNKDQLKRAMQLYLVSDRSWLNNRNLWDDIEQSILGGVTCVQIREKDMEHSAFVNEAKKIKEGCENYQIPFIVNDDVDVMLEVDGDGIHIGQHDMSVLEVRKKIGDDKILGVSAQTVEQAILAFQEGADYLGVGAVFSTNTKQDADDVSYQTLCDICRAVPIPVIAIGGIHAKNILDLKNSGIDGVAVVSAIMAETNIMEATKLLKDKTKELLL